VGEDVVTLEDFWDGEPDPTAIEREPRKCRRHRWTRISLPAEMGTFGQPLNFQPSGKEVCFNCGRERDEALARRGKQSRNYGNRAELKVARAYGGEKIGHAGGPVDVRGAQFNVQVKTHRRPPPAEWRKAFAAMSASRERIPRLLLRFVMPGGVPPDDYFVIRGSDWLAWFGKDEEARADGE
jgi:hypothetical protein